MVLRYYKLEKWIEIKELQSMQASYRDAIWKHGAYSKGFYKYIAM